MRGGRGLTYLTRRGIYALAMGDEAMQVVNLKAVRARQAAARCDVDRSVVLE